MTNVIVLFPKIEDAKNIRNLLTRHGFSVPAVCTTGAQALACANQLDDGILVCGYKYPDMMFSQLHTCLPPHFEMLLVVSRQVMEEYIGKDMLCVVMPLKVQELLSTLELMAANRAARRKEKRLKPRLRSQEEMRIVNEAKELLMRRKGMSEEEAHRYIQKCSMDSGTNLKETAQMVMSILN